MKQGSKQLELVYDKNTEQIYKEEHHKVESVIIKKRTGKQDRIA